MKKPPSSEQDSALSDEALKKYDQVIIRVFQELREVSKDSDRLPFSKSDIERVVRELNFQIDNIPDIAYTYRTGRSALPQAILTHGNWAIDGAGKSKYVFVRLARSPYVDIPTDVETIRILDATPQIVLKYQSTDEQAILARLRYNRLIDTFTSLTTYHFQGHFRTTVTGLGQVEIDDLYIGVNSDGQGFILPIEAKAESPKDRLGVVQITQMVKFARQEFPGLAIRPIGVKVMSDASFMFMEFNETVDSNLVATKRYKRYALYREK